jgi:general secretion pathway protein G
MSTFIHNRRREEGFTLIELMIVMVVIGILAGIVLFAVGNFQTDAQKSRDVANCNIRRTAIAAYQAGHNGDAPADDAALAPYVNGTVPPASVCP